MADLHLVHTTTTSETKGKKIYLEDAWQQFCQSFVVVSQHPRHKKQIEIASFLGVDMSSFRFTQL
jgi:hypothetical protein